MIPSELQKLLARQPERWVLPNGLVIVHQQEDFCPVVSVQIWVHTGSLQEGDWLGAGLSHYLEHLLFKRTARRGLGQIAREAQEMGGAINAYTSFERTVYYLDLPAEHAVAAVDILADMVLQASLDPEDVQAEQGVILREIDMGLDDPDQTLGQAVFRTAFRVHPYRYPVIGHKDLFSQVTAPDLQRYYQARYVPNNMTLVIAGAVDRPTVEKSLEPLLLTAPRRRLAPVYIAREPEQLSMREEHLEGDVSIVRGALAFKVPGFTHPDAPGLDILSSILGKGASSLLWQRLREERRLVHHVEATCWNPGEIGLFWISFLCDADKREQVIEAIFQELAEAADRGFADRDLSKARLLAVAAEINARKTVAGQAARLGMAEVVAGDLNFPQRYFEQLHRLSVTTLPRLLREHLQHQRCTVVTLSPQGTRRNIAKTCTSVRPADFRLQVQPNGARLLSQPDRRLPKVHLRVTGLGGPVTEAEGERGITSLMSTLLLRDTLRKTAAEVAERVESRGGTFQDSVGNNTFGLSLEVLREDGLQAVEWLQESLLEPAFLAETMERERDGLIAAIAEMDDDILEFSRRKLRECFFGRHPFAVDPMGRISDLAALSVEKIRAHWRRLVVSGNLVFTVTGDFDEDILLPRLAELLDALPAGNTPAEEPVLAEPASIGKQHFATARKQVVVCLAFPDCPVGAPEYDAGEVLDELFSDMSGELFRKVREENSLAYFVGANRLSGRKNGMFYFYAGTHPTTSDKVIAFLREEAARARSGMLDLQEFARARTRVKTAKIMQMQNMGHRALQAALDVLYGFAPNHSQLRLQRLERLTLDDVHQFARTYLLPEKAVLVTTGGS